MPPRIVRRKPLQDVEQARVMHESLRLQEAREDFGPGPAVPHALLVQRPAVVHWLNCLGRDFRLSAITRDTAICYLDRVLRTMNVPPQSMELAAVACLLLAAKWEEREQDVPLLRDLLARINNAFLRQEVEVTEKIILTGFDWRLSIVAASSYVDYYARCAQTPGGEALVGLKVKEARE
jgi:hypothetical protein